MTEDMRLRHDDPVRWASRVRPRALGRQRVVHRSASLVWWDAALLVAVLAVVIMVAMTLLVGG